MPEERRQPFRDFPPVEPIDVPEKLSQTFLQHYEECPRSAYLYRKYEGGASSHPLERGTLFHRFAEEAFKTLIKQDEGKMSSEQGRELMEHLIVTEPLVVPYDEQDALYMMAHHFCEATFVDPTKILCAEGMVELDVAGVTLRGRIDFAAAVGTVCEVVDYKTRWLEPNPRELRRFQLAFYCAGLGLGSLDGAPVMEHLDTFNLREEYPRTLWNEQGVLTLAYREAYIDREQLAAFRVYLEGLVTRVVRSFETWDFKAVEGDHCDECPCRAECPIPDYLRRDSFRPSHPEIETAEEAREVASRRFFMGKQMKHDLKALKAWAAEHGEIRFGRDLILEWAETEQQKLKSKPALVAAVERAKIFGEDFELSDHYQTARGTTLRQRALTEHELADEARTNEEENDGGSSNTTPG